MWTKIIFQLIARTSFQSIFQMLHKLSLAGMNYGGGGGVMSSGEHNVLQQLHGVVGEKAVIFDVGANIGDYAQACLDLFPKGKIHCFEPSKTAFKVLSERLKQEKRVQLVNLGLSDKSTIINLYSNVKGSGFGSVYPRDMKHTGIKFNQKEIAKLTTLDLYCSRNRIGHIDLLKLDVEGHELPVLAGATKMLRSKKIKMIQFEFGGCDLDSRTFFRDFYNLLSPNYDLFRIVQDGLVSIKQYRELDEIFVTTNYLAILR